ncbi:MAG: hypothetical protein U0X71_06405 [Sphingobacteriaceae bacterium]|jgi:IS1 family transposase
MRSIASLKARKRRLGSYMLIVNTAEKYLQLTLGKRSRKTVRELYKRLKEVQIDC